MTKLWQRPNPLIGDATSAAQRADDPSGWAFDPASREAFYAVLDARRDIRRFRPDPISDELLNRVLTAAHHGPSVGHSQPWRFIVVDDDAIRTRAAALADQARIAQASVLDEAARRKLLDLQLEGIREAPIGVVVACDRRTDHRGVLGRGTFADADMWSCAAAIENLWLAARAEGLGLGWVTLFQPADLAELMGLPDGVETLGWLCLGWPDERPPEPGLQRQGWSKRMSLDEVVMRNGWQNRPAPAHRFVGDQQRALVPSQDEVVEIRDAADRLLTPPGSLGLLDQVVNRVLQAGPATSELFIVGADHGVYDHAITAFPQELTCELMDAAVAGLAFGSVAAAAHGVGQVRVVDAGCQRPIIGAIELRDDQPRGDLVNQDALTVASTRRLIDAGIELGRQAAATIVCLGEIGLGNTTVAAALTSALLNIDPDLTVGQGAGADFDMIARKADVIRRARARVGQLDDTVALLAALGGAEIAVLTGISLGAAQAGRIVLLDGYVTTAAALAAVRIDSGVRTHLVAGQRSREVGHGILLRELGLEPLLDLRIRAGEGVGAVMAAGLIQRTITMREQVAHTG